MFTPAQWVLIDLANQYGYDKKNYEERLAFGREIKDLIQEDSDMSVWINQAKEPEMFAKSILTVRDILEGIPNGHIIGLDAASSGPQLLSALARCEVGMANTGLLGDKVPDLYTTIYENMDMEGLIRDQVKKATVPFVYGSNVAPESVFGEDAPKFHLAYKTAVPAAYILRDLLLSAWDSTATFHEWVSPNGHVAHVPVWVTKDIEGTFNNSTYKFRTKVNKAKKVGMSLPANVTHTFDAFVGQELTARADYNLEDHLEKIAAIKTHLKHGSTYTHSPLIEMSKLAEHFNFVSVSGLDHVVRNKLDGVPNDYLEALLKLAKSMLKYSPFSVRGIHDEFGAQANYVGVMQKLYNRIVAEAYNSTWLSKTVKALTGINIETFLTQPKKEIFDQICNAKYALH